MRLKMVLVAALVLFFMAGSAYAADISGKWEGEMDMPQMGGGGPGGGGPGGGGPGGGMGPQGPMKWMFDLKVAGSKVTGSVKGPRGGANDIIEGKIDGDKLTLKVKTQGFQGNEMTIKYEGTIKGEEISFEMSFEGGMGGPGGGGPGGGGPGGGFKMPPIVAKKVK